MSRESRKAHVGFEVYKSKVELEIIKRLGPGEMTANIRKAWRIVKDSEELTRLAWQAKKPPLFVAEALTFDMPPAKRSSSKRSGAKRSKPSRSVRRRVRMRRLVRVRRTAARHRGWGATRSIPGTGYPLRTPGTTLTTSYGAGSLREAQENAWRTYVRIYGEKKMRDLGVNGPEWFTLLGTPRPPGSW